MSDTKDSQPKRTITVLARYNGTEPTLSDSEKAFFLGPIPIIEPLQLMSISSQNIIASANKGKPKKLYQSGSDYYENIEILAGGQFFDRYEGRVGLIPGTELVLYAVDIDTLKQLVELENWGFKKLPWKEYYNRLSHRAQQLTDEREDIIDRLANNWMLFYNIAWDDKILDVLRFEVTMPKKQNDKSERNLSHWHLDVWNIRAAQIVICIELLEQFFYNLKIPATIKLFYGKDEVYCTPPYYHAPETDI